MAVVCDFVVGGAVCHDANYRRCLQEFSPHNYEPNYNLALLANKSGHYQVRHVTVMCVQSSRAVAAGCIPQRGKGPGAVSAAHGVSGAARNAQEEARAVRRAQ